MSLPGVSVQLHCPICASGNTKVGKRYGKIVHKLLPDGEDGDYVACPDWDSEFRHTSEPIGFYTFAWWPTRCRNGRLRWLVSVERHGPRDYTLGDRAF